MKETILKTALAGLVHDVGKFAQGNLNLPPQYAQNNADQYQPFYNGHHTHVHALYTAAFIEHYTKMLPAEFNHGGWGEGDSFINLAAGHHKPETPMQWIIAVADRLSSGLDRDNFTKGEKIAVKDYKKTRLLPILETLDPDASDSNGSKDAYQYRYPLVPLSATSIFPVKAEDVGRQDAARDYAQLFDDFTKQLGKLQHCQEDVSLWGQHFDSLLQTCTAQVPAARVGDIVHDVSLYDHGKTTAALASALYSYHYLTGTLDEASVRKGDEEKFLLVTGDFYGIQDFIFSTGGDMQRFRSKILRGRSFSVSLFAELAADLICRELDLSFLSILLNAAGKFTLLAPNTRESRDRVRRVEQSINDWLFTFTHGRASMGIAMTPCCPSCFKAGEYGELHDIHMRDVQNKKLVKLNFEQYGGAIESFLDSFNNELNPPLCSLCGVRPATVDATSDRGVVKEREISTCSFCRDHIMLGTHVVRSNRLAVIYNGEPSTSSRELMQPFFGRYQLSFRNDSSRELRGDTVRYWQVNVNPDGTLFSDVTLRSLNGYVPLYGSGDEQDGRVLEGKRKESKTLELIEQIEPGDPKTFTHIALTAKKLEVGGSRGTEALGVLKADVDNLGLLMSCGLPEKRFTVSRLATLSRQLDAYFAIYLPNLLANNPRFRNVYTVFAGGDDLFLIGPWNIMADLALFLRERFGAYTCSNPALSFSAGITMHKVHTPVDKLAESAEKALESAKDADKKNSVTMFGQTVYWHEFENLMTSKERMQAWLDKSYISSSMMYRFNKFTELAGLEKNALANGEVYLTDLNAMKWRAMFGYSLHRNLDSSLKGRKRQVAAEEVGQMAGWIETYGTAVRIPLWHLLYDKR